MGWLGVVGWGEVWGGVVRCSGWGVVYCDMV